MNSQFIDTRIEFDTSTEDTEQVRSFFLFCERNLVDQRIWIKRHRWEKTWELRLQNWIKIFSRSSNRECCWFVFRLTQNCKLNIIRLLCNQDDMLSVVSLHTVRIIENVSASSKKTCVYRNAQKRFDHLDETNKRLYDISFDSNEYQLTRTWYEQCNDHDDIDARRLWAWTIHNLESCSASNQCEITWQITLQLESEWLRDRNEHITLVLILTKNVYICQTMSSDRMNSTSFSLSKEVRTCLNVYVLRLTEREAFRAFDWICLLQRLWISSSLFVDSTSFWIVWPHISTQQRLCEHEWFDQSQKIFVDAFDLYVFLLSRWKLQTTESRFHCRRLKRLDRTETFRVLDHSRFSIQRLHFRKIRLEIFFSTLWDSFVNHCHVRKSWSLTSIKLLKSLIIDVTIRKLFAWNLFAVLSLKLMRTLLSRLSMILSSRKNLS